MCLLPSSLRSLFFSSLLKGKIPIYLLDPALVGHHVSLVMTLPQQVAGNSLICAPINILTTLITQLAVRLHQLHGGGPCILRHLTAPGTREESGSQLGASHLRELSHSKEHTCRIRVAIPSFCGFTQPSSSIINTQLDVFVLFNHCRGSTAPNQKVIFVIKIIYLCTYATVATQTQACSKRYREAQTKGRCCFLTKRCDERSTIPVVWRKCILDGPKHACSWGYDSTLPS